MDDEYLDMTIRELRTEVLVKGPELVAKEMGVSVKTLRELAPHESLRYDIAWKKDVDNLLDDIESSLD